MLQLMRFRWEIKIGSLEQWRIEDSPVKLGMGVLPTFGAPPPPPSVSKAIQLMLMKQNEIINAILKDYPDIV